MSLKNELTIEDLLNKIYDTIGILIRELNADIFHGDKKVLDSTIFYKKWSKKKEDLFLQKINDAKPTTIIEDDLSDLMLDIVLDSEHKMIKHFSINILIEYFKNRYFKKLMKTTGKGDINIYKKKETQQLFLETEEPHMPEFDEDLGLTKEEELKLNEMFETKTEEVEELPEEEIEVEEPEIEEIDTETFKTFTDTEENQELYKKETGGNPIRSRKPTKRYLKWLEEKK